MIHTGRLRRLSSALIIFGLLMSSVAPTATDRATYSASADVPETAAVTASAAGKTVAGDLSHLVFTATENLHADVLYPTPADVVPFSSGRVDVLTVEGAGVEVNVNGEIVPATQIGAQAVDSKAATARYTYFGVHFKPGPNAVIVTSLGADGLRGASVTSTVYGAGRPVNLRGSLSNALHADGHTPTIFTIVGVDQWKHPALSGTAVRITVMNGDARLLPLPTQPQPAAPGDPAPAPVATREPVPSSQIDATLDGNGVARVSVIPGTLSGNLVIGYATTEIKATETSYIEPFLRKAFVTGLVSAGAGQTPGDSDGQGNIDNGGSKRGRVAIFGVGSILQKASLAFAYDTASRLAPTPTLGAFTDNPAERPYQTYGDSSVRRNDALSSDRLYTRIEYGRSNFTYGRFNADINGTDPTNGAVGAAPSASSYNQVLSGPKLELSLHNDAVHTTLFTAHNDVSFAHQNLAVTGLSTLGQLLFPNIIVASDIVTLVAIDRVTGAVVSQTPLVRDVDYTLDYVSGTFRFITIPLPFDAAFNPQLVSIAYQYAGNNTTGRTTGAKLGLHFNRALNLNVGYVNDVTGGGNFSLVQQSLSGVVPGGSYSLTHSSAAGAIDTGNVLTGADGNAYRGAFSGGTRTTKILLNYDQTSAGYANPYGGYSTPGLLDYRAQISQILAHQGELVLAYNGQSNSIVGGTNNSQNEASLLVHQPIGKRLRVTLGLDRRSEQGVANIATSPLTQLANGSVPIGLSIPLPATVVAAATESGAVTQATFGLEYRVSKATTLSLNRVEDLGGVSTLATPSETQAGIDMALGPNTHAFLRELWTAAPQATFAASDAAVTATQNGTHLTTFGLEQKLSRATALTSEYTIENTGNGTDVFSSYGVRETLALSKHLKADAQLQTSNGTSYGGTTGTDSSTGFTTYGLNLSYGTDRFHAASSFQDRTGYLGGYTITLGAGGPLSPDISLLGNINAATAGGYKTTQALVGLAWRPHDNDRGASLLELERHTNNVLTETDRTDTLSFAQVWRPTERLELDGSFALKLDGDGFYTANTTLTGLRIDQRIGSSFDLGAEVRRLGVAGISGSKQTQLAAEGGIRIGNAMRVAIGYNFTGATDPSLSTAPSHAGAYVTVTSVVSRIFGWGK